MGHTVSDPTSSHSQLGSPEILIQQTLHSSPAKQWPSPWRVILRTEKILVNICYMIGTKSWWSPEIFHPHLLVRTLGDDGLATGIAGQSCKAFIYTLTQENAAERSLGCPSHLSALILDSRLPYRSHRTPVLGSEPCPVSSSWQVRPRGPRSESLLALQKDPPHLSAVTVTLFTQLHSRKGGTSVPRITAWSSEAQMKCWLLLIG